MNTILNDDVPILYELLVYEEWLQDPEIVKSQSSPFSSLTVHPYKLFSYFRQPDWPSEELIHASSPLLPWHVVLSPNGFMVAILQEGLLEVRTQEDDFTSTVGKAIIPKDRFPQLRTLKWHPRNTEIAISSSQGVVIIFDAFCNKLATLPPPNQDELKSSQTPFVAGIDFVHHKNKEVDEFLVVYSSGLIKSFSLTDEDFLIEKHKTQLPGLKQVSSAVYNQHFGILYISAQPQITSRYFQDSCSSAGLSAWRIVSEPPFYELSFPSGEEAKMLTVWEKLWKLINFPSKALGVAVKLCVSQNNKYLASLHACNTIIIWSMPSLRMFRKWTLDDDHNSKVALKIDRAPVDIGWRHDEKLIVSWRDGSISVHNLETFEVCHRSGSDLLSGCPRISSNENFPGFITLECDTILLSPSSEDSLNESENSLLDASSEVIQNAIYFITDIEKFQPKKKSIKVIQKIYRMIGAKSTTPEELFWRKLDSNEYSGALELADEFGLNSDEVYKKLWRTSAVSLISIEEYLSKIRNTFWVLNECVERIPESSSGADDLYKFGFDLTSLDSTFNDPTLAETVLNDPSFNCELLEPLQKHKIYTRSYLFEYAEKLKVYKEILGGNPDLDGSYDMIQYDNFRTLPIVESAIHFARQCNIRALEVIFKYYTSEVKPFWFHILENIPEIYSPSNYHNLLPECDAQRNPVCWKDSHHPAEDWVHKTIFRPLRLSLEEEKIVGHLEPVHTITGATLSDWYCKRALEMESRSKLLQYAQELVRFGIEKNIQGLETLNSIFITLECMIYELELNVDALSFLDMTDLQKAIAIMDKAVPEDFTFKMLKYFIPFLDRNCTEKVQRYRLFFDFLTFTSKEKLSSALSFISYVLDENYEIIGGFEEITPLVVECIYNYSKLDMALETIEVINSCISWILSTKSTSLYQNLLKSLNALRKETIAAQVIASYQIPITVKLIHLLKEKEGKCRIIFKQMTTFVIKEYVKTKSLSKIRTCLQDIISLQEECFQNVRLDFCYEMYASSLLNSGCLELIELSNTVICSKKEVENSCFLSFDHSCRIVLHAAVRYVNSSESVEDEEMSLAKACLFLIKGDHPEINKEIDLIQALRYLNEIGVNLTPFQVRQSADRMKLINFCFDQNPKLYRKSHLVYKLGAKLRVCGNDFVLRHNVLTDKMAKVALADDAISLCTEFTVDLVVNNYTEGWETVYELLKRKAMEDRMLIKVFWSFCVIHAPVRYLSELVDIRNSIYNPSCRPFESVGLSASTPTSLVNTPDSDSSDDYQLASCDYSHRFDEASDAELIPSFCCPYFYSDLGTATDYTVQKTQSFQHSVLQIHHISAEESIFSFVDNQGFNIDPWIIDAKLIELAAKYTNKDTLTALGFLLSTNNPLSCEDFFDKLPQVEFTQELAVYYYSVCSLRGSSTHILKTPRMAVNDAVSLAYADFKSSINKYSKCESLYQAKSLEDENCGVNCVRFLEDDSYKTDTIYGLPFFAEDEDLRTNVNVTEEETSVKSEVRDAIRSFCETATFDYHKSCRSWDKEIELYESGITPAVLMYLFLPLKTGLTLSSDVRSKTGDVHYSKFQVASSLIHTDLPTDTFQKLAGLIREGLLSNDVDRLFLVWLCLTFDRLNLREECESILTSEVTAHQLVEFVTDNPECVDTLIPRTVQTKTFSEVASSLLDNGATETIQRIIKALHNHGMSVEAGTLMMSLSRIPSSLRTFDSSLCQNESL